MLLSIPALTVLSMLGVLLLVLLLKYAVVGTYVVTTMPLWSLGVWRCELLRSVLDVLAMQLLVFFRGTPVIGVWLRALGAKVGPGVYLDTCFVTELDLVTIGAGCCIGMNACLQVMCRHSCRRPQSSSEGPNPPPFA